MRTKSFVQNICQDGLEGAYTELDKRVLEELGEDVDIHSVNDTLFKEPPHTAKDGKWKPEKLVRVVIYRPKK